MRVHVVKVVDFSANGVTPCTAWCAGALVWGSSEQKSAGTTLLLLRRLSLTVGLARPWHH
eukprot:3640566-Amphidinium_carterae.2